VIRAVTEFLDRLPAAEEAFGESVSSIGSSMVGSSS